MFWRSFGLRQLDQNNTTRCAQPCPLRLIRRHDVVEVGLVGFWANFPLLSKTVTVIV